MFKWNSLTERLFRKYIFRFNVAWSLPHICLDAYENTEKAWVQYCHCSRWFHCSCISIKLEDAKENDIFVVEVYLDMRIYECTIFFVIMTPYFIHGRISTKVQTNQKKLIQNASIPCLSLFNRENMFSFTTHDLY